jgi:chromosome segregation protein
VRLKKLTAFGFKSFADKIVIEFPEGITGIVGPNGCGKSNIADAFRWVLGEQSAKSMRGGKMMDVIFAGTNKRPPLNVAEVSLTFTDVKGALPVEYDEVTVTRRLHRNGDSEYLLNRQPIRMKDLQSLFLGSGMGKNAFSIFEQGKIDQVINYSSKDRRSIFEEAAGILRFLQRKKEASRKLEQADQNIDRVNDIHKEIQKQIDVLEKQAELARTYKADKTHMENLEKSILVGKWDFLSERITEGCKLEKDLTDQVETFQQDGDVLREELLASKADLNENETIFRTKNEAVYQVNSEKQIAIKDQKTHKERLEELKLRAKQQQQQIETLRCKRQERALERKKHLGNKAQVDKQCDTFNEQVLRQREKFTLVERNTNGLREQQRSNEKERLALVQEESRIESEIKQYRIRLEGQGERSEKLSVRKAELKLKLEEAKLVTIEKKKELKAGISIIDQKKNALDSMEQSYKELGMQLEQNASEHEELKRSYTELQARQVVLKRLREEMEGFSSASKRLLKESQTDGSPLKGKIRGLFEFLTPQEGSEAAFAMAMRPYNQTLLVETQNDFQEVVAFSKKHQLKDFSLFCQQGLQSKTSQPNLEGCKSLGDSLKPGDIAVEFLKGVYCAEDGSTIEKFMEIDRQGVDIVTSDGFYLDRHGVAFHLAKSENNVFLRENELRKLDTSLKTQGVRLAEQEAIAETLSERKEVLYEERLVMDKEVRQKEMTLVEVNFVLQQANGQLDELEGEASQVAHEMDMIAKAQKEWTEHLKDLDKAHVAAIQNAKKAETLTSTLDGDLAGQLKCIEEEQTLLKELEAESSAATEEQRQLKHRLELLSVQDQEGEQQEENVQEDLERNSSQVDEIVNAQEKNHALLEIVEEKCSGASDECKDLETMISKKKKNIEHLETRAVEIDKRFRRLDKEQCQVATQTGQLKKNRDNLAADAQEKYSQDVDGLRENGFVLELPIDESEKIMKALRRKIADAGDINMTSIDDFEKQKTRSTFYEQQLGDLGGSKEELLEIIKKLDEECRRLFTETFEAVRLNFQKNFELLFRGGEADLCFTDSGDVLESGIDIVAKPPGKKMQSIHLLSGGEKCLTAVALLFAIFEVKPSPFCILDEIDAPLDDANVARFVNVVKQFVDRCQFIIITHNKRTMAIADTLFGISMQEKGVSRLLSMKFSLDEEKEEQEVVGVEAL